MFDIKNFGDLMYLIEGHLFLEKLCFILFSMKSSLIESICTITAPMLPKILYECNQPT